MTSLIDAPWAVSYRLPIRHEPLTCLVSEIFSINVADRQTHTCSRHEPITVTEINDIMVKIRKVSPEGIRVTMEERICERDEF